MSHAAALHGWRGVARHAMAVNIDKSGWPRHLSEYVHYEQLERNPGRAVSRMEVQPEHLAPNGYLQATVLVGLADMTCAGGTLSNLPEGATSFTTSELKINLLRTVLDGGVRCEAVLQHRGRRTQVWDALCLSEDSGKQLALFRCTQLILYPSA